MKVFAIPSPALFRDGAFSCHHELPILPTRAHAPRKRFAAAMRASPLPAGGSGGLCARLRRARGKRSGLHPIAVPLGKGCPQIAVARRCASPCRVNPLPQAARAAPTQGRDLVRAEPQVSVDGSVFKHSQSGLFLCLMIIVYWSIGYIGIFIITARIRI